MSPPLNVDNCDYIPFPSGSDTGSTMMDYEMAALDTLTKTPAQSQRYSLRARNVNVNSDSLCPFTQSSAFVNNENKLQATGETVQPTNIDAVQSLRTKLVLQEPQRRRNRQLDPFGGMTSTEGVHIIQKIPFPLGTADYYHPHALHVPEPELSLTVPASIPAPTPSSQLLGLHQHLAQSLDPSVPSQGVYTSCSATHSFEEWRETGAASGALCKNHARPKRWMEMYFCCRGCGAVFCEECMLRAKEH